MSSQKKIKILFYSGHGEIVGGDAKYLFDLVKSLDTKKYDLSIYTDRNYVFEERAAFALRDRFVVRYLDTFPVLFSTDKVDRRLDEKYMSILNKKIFGKELTVYIRYLIQTLKFNKSSERIKNFILFYRLFQQQKGEVDIFHFNNGGYPGKECGLIAILAAYLCGIRKIVMTIHSEPVPRRLPRLFADKLFDWIIPRLCNVVISASENGKQILVKKRNYSEEKVVTIHCGIEDSKCPGEKELSELKGDLEIKSGTIVLLMGGNLDEPCKGWDVLIQALKIVKEMYPDFILLLAGHGSEKAEKAIKDKILHFNLGSNVRLLGYRNDMEVLNGITDISITPSIYSESTPYTLKEAMRACKPVISSDTGGCLEAVDNMSNGIVVPRGDKDALANAIIKLMKDPLLSNKMGKKGRETFEKKFLLSEKIIEHECIYDSLLAEGPIVTS